MNASILTGPVDGACVYRRGGRTLVGNPASGGVELVEDHVVVRDERGWIMGGWLPPDAHDVTLLGVSSQVAIGDGAWVARFPFEGKHVHAIPLLTDSSGSVLAIAAGIGADDRRPISDATDPCPVCATPAWEVTGSAGPQRIACARCGFSPEGGWWTPGGVSYSAAPSVREPPPPPPPPAPSVVRQGGPPMVGLADRRALEGGPPLLWPSDSPRPRVVGVRRSGTSLEHVTCVTLADDSGLRVSVDARCDERLVDVARDGYVDATTDDQPPAALSPPAQFIWQRARERERITQSRAAAVSMASIGVETAGGTVARCLTVVGTAALWAAAAELQSGEVVAISARRRSFEGLTLAAIAVAELGG